MNKLPGSWKGFLSTTPTLPPSSLANTVYVAYEQQLSFRASALRAQVQGRCLWSWFMNVSCSRNGFVRLWKERLTEFLVEAHNATTQVRISSWLISLPYTETQTSHLLTTSIIDLENWWCLALALVHARVSQNRPAYLDEATQGVIDISANQRKRSTERERRSMLAYSFTAYIEDCE